MIRQVIRDTVELTRACRLDFNWRNLSRVLQTDSYPVLVLNRVREAARRWHVPGVNRTLRYVQMAVFGIEVGKDVELGAGVYFVHTLGTVIGGDAKIGNRVRFMGSNTVGTAKDNGYPIIEDDVVIGAGARILGPVRIGARAQIGANAVVLRDVPPDSVATGVPAKVHEQKDALNGNASSVWPLKSSGG